MAEKMVVAQALDERDFLRKKILEKIGKLNVATVVKSSDKTTENGTPIDKYQKDAVAAVQSIRDLIKRYKAINLAIAKSNTSEIVTVNGVSMTRAEAITLRKDHVAGTDLDDALNRTLFQQIQRAQAAFGRQKTVCERTKKDFIQTLLNSEKTNELDQDKIDAVSKITDGDTPVLVDPINLADKVDTYAEEQERFYKELETAIKVSNASTFIEID